MRKSRHERRALVRAVRRSARIIHFIVRDTDSGLAEMRQRVSLIMRDQR
jgi:hypothetical protein